MSSLSSPFMSVLELRTKHAYRPEGLFPFYHAEDYLVVVDVEINGEKRSFAGNHADLHQALHAAFAKGLEKELGKDLPLPDYAGQSAGEALRNVFDHFARLLQDQNRLIKPDRPKQAPAPDGASQPTAG